LIFFFKKKKKKNIPPCETMLRLWAVGVAAFAVAVAAHGAHLHVPLAGVNSAGSSGAASGAGSADLPAACNATAVAGDDVNPIALRVANKTFAMGHPATITWDSAAVAAIAGTGKVRGLLWVGTCLLFFLRLLLGVHSVG
jgi:hypothetical protein